MCGEQLEQKEVKDYLRSGLLKNDRSRATTVLDGQQLRILHRMIPVGRWGVEQRGDH